MEVEVQQVQTNNELSGEPALYAALASSGVQLFAAFFLPISDAQVAVINAAILAWVKADICSPDFEFGIRRVRPAVAQRTFFNPAD